MGKEGTLVSDEEGDTQRREKGKMIRISQK